MQNGKSITGKLFGYSQWGPLGKLAQLVPDADVISSAQQLAEQAVRFPQVWQESVLAGISVFLSDSNSFYRLNGVPRQGFSRKKLSAAWELFSLMKAHGM